MSVMYLWERLTGVERRDALRTARTGKTVEIPLGRFSRADLEVVTRMLRAYGTGNAQSWHPDFPDVLRGGVLAVEASSKEVPPDASHVTIQIEPDDRLFVLWGAKADFIWQPTASE